MTALVGMLALAVVGQGDIGGDEAIAVARDFALRLQITQPLTVTRVFLESNPKRPKLWHVAFDFAKSKGGFVSVDVDLAGKVAYAFATDGVDRPVPPEAQHSPATIAEATKLLDAVGCPMAVDRTPEIGIGAYHVLAKFYVVKNGLRFANLNPTYAVLIGFRPGSNGYRWYTPSPALPATPVVSPVLSSQDAVRRAVWTLQPQTRDLDQPQQIVDLRGKATLCYYAIPHEKMSRLVWAVDLSVVRALGESEVSLYWRKVFVDAYSGMMFELAENATDVRILVSRAGP